MNIRFATLLLLAELAYSASVFDVTDVFHKRYLPWTYGSCLQFDTIDNFESTKFFTDRWYEHSSYGNYLFQGDSICSAFESRLDGDSITYLFYQYEPVFNKYVYLRGKTEDFQERSNYSVQFDFFAGLASIKVPYSVVATDYENYSVFYTCQEAFGFKAEMAWIATRRRGDSSHDEEIKRRVYEVGLDYENFIPQSSTGCGASEPHL